VPGALDQIVQRFGTDMVAEVTGRSRRIVRKEDRFAVENRAPSANLAETAAFMDDGKRVLVFSDAGGTGRSYHAELSARNQRLRVHYLLEPGWKADAAIQGLGRTNRTNQAQPPLVPPDRDEREGGEALPLDHCPAARHARRDHARATPDRRPGPVPARGQSGIALCARCAAPALRPARARQGRGMLARPLRVRHRPEADGRNGIKDELPPITTFLNRLLALTIELQGILFTAFEQLLDAKVEGAIASGIYDAGLETLTAESFIVTGRQTIYTIRAPARKPGCSPSPSVAAIAPSRCAKPSTISIIRRDPAGQHAQAGRRADPAPSIMLDDGEIERRVRLIRPMENYHASLRRWGEPLAGGRPGHLRLDLEPRSRRCRTFSDSTLHVVAGLLLPIWKRLPDESTRVYRLQTDDGERIIGRRVSPAWAMNATDTGRATLTADSAYTALVDGRTTLDLAEGLQLRRVRVMGANRIELTGFHDTMRERLRVYGLFSEIISWKLRFFVPIDAAGPAILGKLLDTYPVARISEKEAA
jgi:hypothetical protein